VEREDDAQLICKVLSGDDEAFNTLVQKYQKSVHAFVWRKIEDFHYAEEITQDTFLQAHKKLSTLRDPNQFAGWVYTIANRLCIAWMRKQKPAMQLLSDTSVKEIDNLAYERYVSEQRESEATAHRYEIVENLLKKLPESEHTVMTLYYLGEMTIKEIGKSLGVSANTITSRLHRARKRLQVEQEVLIVDLETYHSQWRRIVETFSAEDAKKRILPEIETLLREHPETPELLNIAYWGYMELPGRSKNVPNSLFDKMLRYPKTENYLTALLGLAERSEDASQQWYYYQRVINAFTTSDTPILSWHWLAYKELLRLAEADRSLANDDDLDELIDGCLEAHLSYCQETQQWFGWAYTESVKYRLKFDNRLDKAWEVLARADIRLAEAEEQKWLVENNKGSVKEERRNISRLRCEIYIRQERWREAHDGLVANAPDYLESLWARFNEDTMNYFYMLGRSAEGVGDYEEARRYYADAYFAPMPRVEKVRHYYDFADPHFVPMPRAESQRGLERLYHEIKRAETTDTLEAFLKDTEAEYRIREGADLEKIRRKLITNRLKKKATDFRLETLEGETYTLSAMSDKIVLLAVGGSLYGGNMVIPEVELVYERFSNVDDVVIWDISDGEAPQKVREFLEQYQPPWPLLLDPHRQVKKAYQIERIPSFILIDKAGNWQYSFIGLDLIGGQPLIWMIEALLAD
jgi:RNA polymerase sigma factor (sigma-70 family)